MREERTNPEERLWQTRRKAPVRRLVRMADGSLSGEIKARYKETWHPLTWLPDGRLRRDREHGSDLLL